MQKKILPRSIIASIIFSTGLLTSPAHANPESDRLIANEPLQVTVNSNPIVTDTYRSSIFLNRGQRKVIWNTFKRPADYDQLAAFVAISYGDLLSVSCKISLFDGNNAQPFKVLDCRRSQQWNPTTPDVPVFNTSLRAKIELYNADFTKSGKRVSLILTPNFANQNDIDQDGLPAWFEMFHDLSDNDAASDIDQDSYTALEEYLGGSNPLDANSVPVNP
ncbi:hypothetical protein [Shewanella psychrophila]|nr:hypothetical protein [Shewanella psychrophila]